MTHQNVCDAAATPSFPYAEDAWISSSLPVVNLNRMAHHTDGTACLSDGDEGHVNPGQQSLPNSTSETLAISDGGPRSDAIVSGSARTSSRPVCLDLRINRFSSQTPSPGLIPRDQYSCRLPACDWMARGLDGAAANRYTNALLQHEESHFGQNGRFVCLEVHCHYVTKRWGDLTRHYSKHCTNHVRKFMCPVVWCKYSSDGFARKDKLKSHIKNVHRGEAKPGIRAGQMIRPNGQDGL